MFNIRDHLRKTAVRANMKTKPTSQNKTCPLTTCLPFESSIIIRTHQHCRIMLCNLCSKDMSKNTCVPQVCLNVLESQQPLLDYSSCISFKDLNQTTHNTQLCSQRPEGRINEMFKVSRPVKIIYPV